MRVCKIKDLIARVVRVLFGRTQLTHYFYHYSDCDADFRMEDSHAINIVKKIADLYLDSRLFAYSKTLTPNFSKKSGLSKRHLFYKLVLFSH